MKRLVILFGMVVLLAAALPGHAGASSFDCAGGIVSEGDSRADLLAKCGEPDLKDSHPEEVIERLVSGQILKTIVNVEEWTYNLGPSRLMRIVTFRNGVIADIRTGGYGYERKEEKKKAP